MLTRDHQAGDPVPAHAAPPGLLARAVRRFDAFVRKRLGVFEYTNDPQCVLRLSLHEAAKPVVLSGGVRVQPGDRMGELHLWNEQLPPMHSGADVAWAAVFYRRLVCSLQRLGEYVESQPACADVAAFRVRPMFEGWRGPARLPRLARRLGFEAVDRRPPGPLAWLLSWGGSLLMRGLLLAFNPAAIRGRPLHRRPQEFWIARETLMERYGKKRRKNHQPGRDLIDRPPRDSDCDSRLASAAHAAVDGDAPGGDRLDGDGARRGAGRD